MDEPGAGQLKESADEAQIAPVVPIRRLPAVRELEDQVEPEDDRPLPEPGSAILRDLGVTGVHAVIYSLLYHGRASGSPTMLEIRDHIYETLEQAQSQTDRRLRDLRKHFVIRSEQVDGAWRYRLAAWRERPAADDAAISLRTRAIVLAPQMCAQCGRTPLEDHVKLHVDHKIPQSWGGGNEIENLQPLCEDCSAGKRDYYASYDSHAEEIRLAIGYDEPHKRIGELLKAFNGTWVPTDFIGMVASAKQYQEDYQKRLRELRTIGWVIQTQKRYNEGYRVRTYYRAEHWEPWPDGSVRAAIAAVERQKRTAKKASRHTDDPHSAEGVDTED